MAARRGKTPAMTDWERRNRNKDIRDEMLSLQRAGLSQKQIGGALGVNQATVNRWMERLDIPARRLMWVVPEAVA